MKTQIQRIAFLLSFLGMALAACASIPAGESEPIVLRVMTHDSFSMSESLARQFEEEHKLTLEFLKSGDAGAMLNKAILTKDAPLADVLFGVDDSFLDRALKAGIFEPYESPLLQHIDTNFILDPQHRALPVDYGDVCLNYDRAWFESHALALPSTLEDLAAPAYRGLLVVENPATSSTGLAFLLATVSHFGEDRYSHYWESLRENDVQVAEGWETAYYTFFSGSAGKGARPLVVSYASSPVAEIVFAESELEEPPTGSLLGPGMCYRQIEFAGILAGTKNREAAEAFIDFLLDVRFQEEIPLQMFVFPVHDQAQLPPVFESFAGRPEQPATLAPESIAENRDNWIRVWTQVVLQ